MQGFDATNLLFLRSDSLNDQWNITLQAGGLQSLSYLDVQDSDASNGLLLVAGTTSVGVSQNNINWSFGAATLTWDGDTSTDWDDPSNWDLGFVPGTGDSVIIPDTSGGSNRYPSLTAIAGAGVSIVNMTVSSGATLTLAGKNFTMTGQLDNEGNVILYGSETVAIDTPDTDSGTFTFVGDNDASEVFTIPDIENGAGVVDYFNIVINDTAANEDTYRTNGELVLGGALTVTDGVFDNGTNENDVTVGGSITVNGGTFNATVGANSGSLDVEGNFTQSSGTFVAPDGGETFTLEGDFDHSGGTFTHSSGTLTLSTTADQTISGSTTFYGLIKNVSAAASLTFDNTATQTIAAGGNIDLQGVAGNLLTVQSDSAGDAFEISVQPGATQTLNYLSVQDSDASAGGGITLVARNSVEVGSSTTNWIFGAATLTWQGDDGGSPTDWEIPTNWDLGLVPNDLDTAIIPAVANSPTLTADARVEILNITGGAMVLSLDGNALTIDDTLSNDGTIQLIGSESVSITNIDVDSGTFRYIGDGSGTTRIIKDFGTIDYYNLIINDGGASPDIFQSAADLNITGSLSVTSGTLDISANSNSLTAAGSLTNDGGTLSASSANIDIEGSFSISGGTVTAPGSGKTFSVGDDWSNTGGAFDANSGEVTLDTANTVTVTGNTTFYDIDITVPNKIIEFADGSNQTVTNDLDFLGTDGNEIVLDVVGGGTDWNITIPNGNQSAQFVNVSNSNALNGGNGYTITCFSCTDGGNNNVNWVFLELSIDVPLAGRTTDATPTIIGTAGINTTVDIRSGPDVTDPLVATVTSDANGNFRVEVDEDDALADGSITIYPFLGALSGGGITFTIDANVTSAQQPVIITPTNGTRVNGDKPTITGEGLASTAFVIQASDELGNLLLQSVASGTSGADGSINQALTTALTKGSNYVSITVNGVASDIIELKLTDPFGVVFDSISDQPINGAEVSIYLASTDELAVPGTDLAADDVNPVTTGTDGFYSFLTAPNDYYIVINTAGYDYPSVVTGFSGRSIVNGSRGEKFTVSSTVIEMDHPADPNGQVLRVEKSANKSEVRIGDVVTYTVTIENLSTTDISSVYIEDRIPPGFKYLENRVILDDIPIENPSGNRPLLFNIGDMPQNTKKTLKYQLVVGAGVTIGDYENLAWARYLSGQILSNKARSRVNVVLDPLFDLGTIIGKVYFDRNENGKQDPPVYSPVEDKTVQEDPIPNVKLVMEDGTIITTDDKGRYSIPGLLPGRHLVRIDERTLPSNSYITTDKVVIVDVRPGLPSKVNFGVNLNYAADMTADERFFTNNVKIEQEEQRPTPRLNVSYYGDEIIVYEDVLIHKAEFRIFINYAPFIEVWKLDIMDEDTRRVIKSFEGTRFNIHDPIYWDGRDRYGQYINLDRDYVYTLSVEDNLGNYDETKPKPIIFKELVDEDAYDEYMEDYERDQGKYLDWVRAQNKEDYLMIQTINVDGETIFFDRLNVDLNNIQILKDGQLIAEVPVIEKRGLTARELLEFKEVKEKEKLEVILPKGDYDILIQERDKNATKSPAAVAQSAASAAGPLAGEFTSEDGADPSAEISSQTKAYSKTIRVGEDFLFFVAMGDAQVGYTFTEGDVEPVAQDDKFTNGFWTEGKLAYFIKGKIKGKYIITSSYDSERDKKEIFRNIDPDKYYPVYGDDSVRNFDATNTQGNLYLLIEWDKSSALWGNYSVNFNDTEFARFSKSLYGAKVDFESLKTTKFGEPRSKAVVFHARVQQKSAHVEMLATGGSLYYFKHKDVIPGSDKVTIQVRDKITGLVVSEREMKESADYEMDYESGRMLFWKPVPILVEDYSIISSELLDGNLVYVVADYEYDLKDKYDQANVGGRVRQAVTDNILIGGTYVLDNQDTSDYSLMGTDVTVQLTKDASITAEYAQTESDTVGTFVSTDGGLSYTEISTPDDAQGRAYGIRGDARLFNRLGITSYYKWIDNDFASAATTAQQGKELIGFEAVFDITDDTRVTFRQDIQSLVEEGNEQTQLQLGALKTRTTLMQLVHKYRKLTLTAEYQNQSVTERLDQYDTQTNTDANRFAVRGDYELVSDKVELSLEQQFSMENQQDYQTTAGIKVKPQENVTLKLEETFGQDGTATTLGATADVSERLSVTGEYAFQTSQEGSLGRTATVGATAKLDETSSLTTSLGMTQGAEGEDTTTLAIGGTSQVDPNTTMDTTIAVTESSTGGETASYTFGTRKRVNQDIEMASTQTLTMSDDEQSTSQDYKLVRTKSGRRLEGSLSRKYTDNASEVTRSNIFGLTGDIDDRWALTGSLERGEVQNIDGTKTTRSVLSLGAGYVYKDPETGEQALKGSSKFELRFDDGEEDTRQYVFYAALEGKINPSLTIYSKLELSKTRNVTTNVNEAAYKELVFGGAYRPVMNDRLNMLARYTYLENQGPSSQSDEADVVDENAHVISTEAIYDINEYWQIAEKFAYRIAQEKVEGFDFNRTHTWLMIHRLNYKINKDWMLGGEFRMLSQREAQDVKKGYLVEAARRLGEYAQLGVGYNFTDFDDDLTRLDYHVHGPFVRLTGKLYDRTPEEIERAKELWLNEKIDRWAWAMVMDELSNNESPIMEELNHYFFLAGEAFERGDLEESRQIYRDLIMAGKMMYEEAAQFIREQIGKENKLEELYSLAEQHIKNGQYEKAKKILEKIVVEAEEGMLE
ncbi:MAG: DUF11 domain-containing protein [Candidatus Omnitrophica bacterium]|nr:DUF11 domain-containing protein [Candidatus Omnitrophota bacterium]